MSEREMHTSPMEIYKNENYKKTPVKKDISNDTKIYHYEIVKNKNEELLVINFLNFTTNDNSSSYLVIESSRNRSTVAIVLAVCFTIFVTILILVIIYIGFKHSKNNKNSKIEDCQYSSSNMNLMPPDGTNNNQIGGERPYYMM